MHAVGAEPVPTHCYFLSHQIRIMPECQVIHTQYKFTEQPRTIINTKYVRTGVQRAKRACREVSTFTLEQGPLEKNIHLENDPASR